MTPVEIKSGRTRDGPVVQQSAKNRKVDLNLTIIIDNKMDKDEDGDTRSIWLSDPISHIELTQKDRSALIMCDRLNDDHINLVAVQESVWVSVTSYLTKLKEPLPVPCKSFIHEEITGSLPLR